MRSARAFSILIAAAILTVSQSALAQAGWRAQARLCEDYSRESALAACEQAILLMPDYAPPEEQARVYLYMGIALGELGRNDEAMRMFEKARKLDRENAKIYYNMGVALDEKGEYGKALINYRRATDRDIQMIDAWGNRGVDAYLTRRWEEASISFDNAFTIDPAYFDTRPEQRDMWAESADIHPKTVSLRREVAVRVSPMLAYMTTVNSGKLIIPELNDLEYDYSVDKFVYLMLDGEVDVQIYKRWYATGSFMYSHTSWKDDHGVDWSGNLYAPSFGVKYAVILTDEEPAGNTMILNRARYFFSLAVGPYVTSLSASLGAATVSTTKVDVGVNVGAGFDYYFHPNVGCGIQMKMHYVAFDENYFLISGGPHLLVRF